MGYLVVFAIVWWKLDFVWAIAVSVALAILEPTGRVICKCECASEKRSTPR